MLRENPYNVNTDPERGRIVRENFDYHIGNKHKATFLVSTNTPGSDAISNLAGFQFLLSLMLLFSMQDRFYVFYIPWGILYTIT
jgi:hypothetical protein